MSATEPHLKVGAADASRSNPHNGAAAPAPAQFRAPEPAWRGGSGAGSPIAGFARTASEGRNARSRPASRDIDPDIAGAHDRDDIVVRALSKRYQADTPVLRNVSFSVRAGQSVALIGANGAGKSTLLRCCVHLLRPDEGEVSMFGRRLEALAPAALRALRSRVGFVFQKHNLVPRLSALSNVLHGALPRSPIGHAWFQSCAPQSLRDEALQCLERVGLSHIALQRADRLSGGQSQRVAIARALMQRPSLMVADEPVASLDPVSGQEVMEIFAGLVRTERLTMLFTSHDLEHAVHYADRVIALRQGEIVLDAASSGLNVAGLRSLYE